MSAPWTFLEWDSEFFGLGIGRVELDGLDDAAVAEVEAEARAQGVVCLYGSVEPVDAQLTYRVQELGYRFVENATTFDLRLDEPPIPCPPGVTVRLGTPDDLPALAGMIDGLAPWSRFAVDPRFGLEASRRMQHAWAERGVRPGSDEHQLVLAEDDTGAIAFITRTIHPTPRVDGVGTTARGSGAARYLIEDARAWAAPHALLGGPIASRNVAALRYVSHCNYRVAHVRYLYHRWLDEDR
ncbi:MAG: hypothetical protein R2746_08400 [Acidimicrobiales bacterium]|nr:hypothetical protein [Actinomycetota bacterium]